MTHYFRSLPSRRKKFFPSLLLISLLFLLSQFSASNAGTGVRKAVTPQKQSPLLSPLGYAKGTAPIALAAKSGRTLIPGVVVVRMQKDSRIGKAAFPLQSPGLAAVAAQYNISAMRPLFPNIPDSRPARFHGLKEMYTLHFSEHIDPIEVAMALDGVPEVLYAEPKYAYPLLAVPDDSLYSQMQQFQAISAELAWDIARGENGDVVIAIVDGGTDWQHEDLNANIWNNADEVPDNGVDDDNNGYVDDVRGWNFARRNNDPSGLSGQPVNGGHGTHTAGTAGAVTNNKLGVASISWNATIMPINASAGQQDRAIQYGFEGIVYAAENGADIINCSWGSPGIPSSFEQDIIDFAYAKGSLIVAAAGNDNANNDLTGFFPASYNHVLSVGSTNNADRKSSFSNYGISIDVFAPGSSILSTYWSPSDSSRMYAFNSGTSMASPLVAGLAALVKTKNPDMTVDQLREQIRTTSDPIDALNSRYADSLGAGRVNALKALTESGPSVRIVGTRFIDGGANGIINAGENIEVTVFFTNYLSPVSDVSVELRAFDGVADISVKQATISQINSGDTTAATFSFLVDSNVPDGTHLRFVTAITAGEYSDKDFFQLIVNPPQFLDHDTGPLQTSITTQGNIGFFDFAGSGGSGFVYKGNNVLFEGGLMLGTSDSTVSDCIRGVDESQNDDFKPAFDSSLGIISPGEQADEEGLITLVDSLAANPLGVSITQETFAFKSEPLTDFIIFKYTITNHSTTDYDSMFAGLFFDWDINEDAVDHARFEQGRRLGIAQNSKNGARLLAATKILTADLNIGFHAIDNPGEIYGGDAGDGFTDQEKWQFLSSGIQRTSLDATDISTLTSVGPFALAAGKNIEVAFALIAGESESDLFGSADIVQQLWDNDLVYLPDTTAAQTTTAVLQNPLLSKYADIVVVTDKSLRTAPAVSIDDGGGDVTPVSMVSVPNTSAAFKGSYEFTRSGTYTITTASTTLGGADTTQTRSFSVQNASSGQSLLLYAPDNSAWLQSGGSTIERETWFLAERYDRDGHRIAHFGPERRFQQPLTVAITFSPAQFPDAGKIFIYHKAGNDWQKLDTRVDAARNTAFATTSTLGEFRLGSDSNFSGDNSLPLVFMLEQNYPNPFNPETSIRFSLPNSGQVRLEIFSLLGTPIRTLISETLPAGNHVRSWDGLNDSGAPAASGVYFYRLSAAGQQLTRKMVLLR